MRNLYIISGVAGMTGSETAKRAAACGEVIGFDNFFAADRSNIEGLTENPKFTFLEYDLNNCSDMSKLMHLVESKREEFDRLLYINCAAVVHTEYFYDVNATFDTNVIGMCRLLDQAVGLHADCFINCSTSEVYSMQSYAEGGVREDSFLTFATAEHSQRTSYAAGKLMTEFFMRDAVEKGRIRGCSIRFANVYGNHELYPKHIIPHILTSLLRDGKVTLLENSKINKRTFLHNYDSCEAVLALCNTQEALDGSVYNVATDEEISILDLVALCADKLGIKKPEIIFEGSRASDPVRRVLSSEKIRSRTGWTPKVDLNRGIDMCITQLRESECGKEG